MKLVNEKVKHIKFGNGIIKKADDKNIEVLFDDVEGEKIFRYPEAFGKFLKIGNSKKEVKIMKAYQDVLDENELEKQSIKKEKEAEKQRVTDEAVKPKKRSKKTSKKTSKKIK